MTDHTREPSDVTVNARLSKTEVHEIDALAATEDRTRSAMIRRLIHEALDNRNKQSLTRP
jgi:predicted transcriptional regulator